MPNSNSTPQRYIAKPREMQEVYHVTSAEPVSIRDYDYTFAPNKDGEYDLYAWVEIAANGDENVIVQEGARFREIWMLNESEERVPCEECGAWAPLGKTYCATHD